MSTTEDAMRDEAERLLQEAGDDPLPGLEADTKVSILGTTVATNKDLVLGQRVEARITGIVKFVGDELIENEGKRRIVKVQSNLIEIITDDE
jgi:hypothetical protein